MAASHPAMDSMNPHAAGLFEKALQLSAQDRADLAFHLIASLDPPESEESDVGCKAARTSEIERRLKQIEADPSCLVPADKAIKQIRRSLLQVRNS
jgi:putative addiction module component (TIGR02574 family)